MSTLKNTVRFALLVVCALWLAGVANAQEAKRDAKKPEPKITSTVKEIQGEVSWIRKNSISVVYEHDLQKGSESEILLPMDPATVRIVHKRSLKDISSGDIVRVQYIEELYDYGDRQETKLKARSIRFVKPRDDKSPYKGLGVSAAEPLTLKGVKSDGK